MTTDLLRTLRDGQAAAQGALDRLLLPTEATAGAAFVGRVFGNPAVPTAPGLFYAVHPVTVLGAAVEGGPGDLTVNEAVTVLVDVIGTQAPAAGDYLICRFVSHRWVAERMAPNKYTVILPGCPCPIVPEALYMTVNDPSLNAGMFQDATIVYGPVPPEYRPLYLGPKAYLSTETFRDSYLGTDFRYFFTCYMGYYCLGRLFAVSMFGSPFRDFYRYSWMIGIGGNTCSPFLLRFGQVFPGGDPRSVVTLSE